MDSVWGKVRNWITGRDAKDATRRLDNEASALSELIKQMKATNDASRTGASNRPS